MNTKKRLFLAIPLPEEMIAAFSGYEKQFSDLPHARWVPPENFHITVYFIGWVEESNLSEITERLAKAFMLMGSFYLQFDKIIWAPPSSTTKVGTTEGQSPPPRMIWALFERSPDFENLVEKVDKAARSFLSRETMKESIPHVTLVRFDASSKWKKIKIKQPDLRQKNIKINQINLMESRLLRTGPIYSEVANFYLTK